jgi:hypothetical protein
MKITIDVDCTPEEARAFLGLPDVGPLQARMMKEVEDRMAAALKSMDPQEMLKAWFPGGLPGGGEALAGLQKAFWDQFAGGAASKKK